MGGGKAERACEMFPTKTDAGRADHESLQALTDRAMAIRNEMRSGYPRSPAVMSHIEFKAYLLVTEGCEWQEQEHRANLENYLKAGFGLKPA